MVSLSFKKIIRSLILVILITVLFNQKIEAYTLVTNDKSTLNFDFELGAGFFAITDDYSGQNRENVVWEEGYAKFGFSGNYELIPKEASLYGGLNSIANGTFGDGDAGGFTNGSERQADLEDAYIGIKNKLNNGAQVDISLGAQQFVVGSGFLIGSDIFNYGKGFDDDVNRGGTYYLSSRQAFRNTGILRITPVTPLKIEAFYLGSNNPAQGDSEVAGINVEYSTNDLGTFGFMFLNGLDSNTSVQEGLFRNRPGLNNFNLRFDGNLGVKNASFGTEFVYQENDGSGVANVEAYAWYIMATYKLSDWAWTPKISYRYSFFTGNDPDTIANEEFDPLFYGYTRFGVWFQGEIGGNYSGPFNANTAVHHAEIDFQPNSKLELSLLAFHFETDEPGSVASDNYGNELDLVLSWEPTESLYISPALGFFDPGEGSQIAINNRETSIYFQLLFNLTY